jgi:hypothetical protein
MEQVTDFMVKINEKDHGEFQRLKRRSGGRVVPGFGL